MSLEKKIVSIQGTPGSFHEKQARKIWRDAELLYRETFSEVFNDLLDGKCDYMLTAVCNSLIGELPEPARLLKEHGSKIEVLGHQKLHIPQNLIVIPGTKLEEIKEVWSQDPALRQCHKFLEKHPDWKAIKKNDTAKSVADMINNKDKSVAAIGSSAAAELYQAQILEENIQDSAENFTTFAIACLALPEMPTFDREEVLEVLRDALKKGVINLDYVNLDELLIQDWNERRGGQIALHAHPLKALEAGVINTRQLELLLAIIEEKATVTG